MQWPRVTAAMNGQTQQTSEQASKQASKQASPFGLALCCIICACNAAHREGNCWRIITPESSFADQVFNDLAQVCGCFVYPPHTKGMQPWKFLPWVFVDRSWHTQLSCIQNVTLQVFCVDWSPDGSSVASGGKDHVIKLWRHWVAWSLKESCKPCNWAKTLRTSIRYLPYIHTICINSAHLIRPEPLTCTRWIPHFLDECCSAHKSECWDALSYWLPEPSEMPMRSSAWKWEQNTSMSSLIWSSSSSSSKSCRGNSRIAVFSLLNVGLRYRGCICWTRAA